MMKKHFEEIKNLICLIISLIIAAFLAITLGMQIMFPTLILAIIVLGGFPIDNKRDWPAVVATILGGLIIQVFILL